MKKVGIVLAGCGYLDGAEIRESVLTLLALDKQNCEIIAFAPNENQHHTVNHLEGNEVEQTRNILEESARIMRGQVQDLKNANASELDALVLPGGFGVAKNLSNFAFNGAEAEINTDYLKLIREMNEQGKAIAAICIAPAIIALALRNKSPKITIGNDEGTASLLESLGATHMNCSAGEICVDEANKIVTTPAYMYDSARVSEVAIGIEKCIEATLSL